MSTTFSSAAILAWQNLCNFNLDKRIQEVGIQQANDEYIRLRDIYTYECVRCGTIVFNQSQNNRL